MSPKVMHVVSATQALASTSFPVLHMPIRETKSTYEPFLTSISPVCKNSIHHTKTRPGAATMSENSSDAGQNPQPSTETVPYTITEQDGTVNVAFTSGPQQGDNFQIDRPQGVGAGQPKKVEEEPPYPVSHLDGNGNEISKEEYERLAAIELAEEARRERESGTAQAERRT